LIDEKIIKEWKGFGKTDRDWVKTKIISFKSNGIPYWIKIEDYR